MTYDTNPVVLTKLDLAPIYQLSFTRNEAGESTWEARNKSLSFIALHVAAPHEPSAADNMLVAFYRISSENLTVLGGEVGWASRDHTGRVFREGARLSSFRQVDEVIRGFQLCLQPGDLDFGWFLPLALLGITRVTLNDVPIIFDFTNAFDDVRFMPLIVPDR